MAKQDNQNNKPAGKPAQESSKPNIQGKVVNLKFEQRQPAAIPPKMELKPPKK